MDNVKKEGERIAEGILTICLNEVAWNIVRNDCEEWVEVSYAVITHGNIVYSDELYILCDKYGFDSGELEVDINQIDLILDRLNQRHKLWEVVSKKGDLLWKPRDIGFRKIVIITSPEFGRLTPEAIKHLKEEYFEIPVEILH